MRNSPHPTGSHARLLFQDTGGVGAGLHVSTSFYPANYYIKTTLYSYDFIYYLGFMASVPVTLLSKPQDQNVLYVRGGIQNILG
jgi:hypothetical protein